MIFLFLLLPSLCAALAALVVRPFQRFVGWLNALLSLVAVGAAIFICRHLIAGGAPLTFGPGEVLRVDSLSALFISCVAAVASLTLWLSPGLGRESHYNKAQLGRYHLFINLFIFAMLLAVSANNVGIMWIALEATTIFSAMIIPLTLTKASVEASWKYILICSVGIALAFAGTVLGYFDFVALSGHAEGALNWPVLLATAPSLHPEVMRMAFVFILIGYGTKAGLAPMHTWLPDAHSEAPSQLSAVMSGVLLAVALYAILRWKVVVDATVGGSYSNHLLLALGLLSLLIAAFSIVLSRNYKRMLAYSSIEHTGLLCIGLALGPLGTFAAMLHLVNHTAAKSMMFLLAGRIMDRYKTTRIKQVSGLLKVMPVTGGLFAVGMLAIIGLPPFGIFISELYLFRAGFAAQHYLVMGVVLILLTVAFVAMLNQLTKMLYGEAPPGTSRGEAVSWWWFAPMIVPLVILIALGLSIPTFLTTLIDQIVSIVTNE
jgi:hydrogenase-4 component F